MDSQYAVSATNIQVSIKGKPILKDINLNLQKGKIYGLLGPNGAGKTTLLKVLLGIFPPSEGTVLFEGQNIYEKKNQAIIESIGSIIEYPGFYENLTLYENIELHLRYLDETKNININDVLKKVGLYEHKDKLFSQTSLGMKQRLGIARAVASSPQILLLDEPTNGLDPYGIKEVREMLIQEVINKGTTVVISSHLLSEINLMADDLIIMNNGKIIFESSFLKNNQDLYLYKLNLSQDLDYKDIEMFSSHILLANQQYVEFISILNPKEIAQSLDYAGIEKPNIDGFKLSLEDLYLKLLAKENEYESITT